MRRLLAVTIPATVALAATIAAIWFAVPALAASPTATFVKTSDWGTGWEGKYTITNGGTTTITSWNVQFDLPSGTSVGTYWDALMTSSGQHYTFTNRSWNVHDRRRGQTVRSTCTAARHRHLLRRRRPCRARAADPVPGHRAPVVGTVTNTSIALSWGASSGTVTGYRVYEGTRCARRPDLATITGWPRAPAQLPVAAQQRRRVAGRAVTAPHRLPRVPGTPGNPRVTGTTNTSHLAGLERVGRHRDRLPGLRGHDGAGHRHRHRRATVSGLAACTSHTYTVAAYNSRGRVARVARATGTTTGCPTAARCPSTSSPATGTTSPTRPSSCGCATCRPTTTWSPSPSPRRPARRARSPSASTRACPPRSAATPTPTSRPTCRPCTRAARRSSSRSAARPAGCRSATPPPATNFATTVHALMQEYGFDGVDIDLENGLNPTFMGRRCAALRSRVGAGPDHHDGAADDRHAVDRRRRTSSWRWTSGTSSPSCTRSSTTPARCSAATRCRRTRQGTVNFMTALACIQLENGLRPDQVALGLPAGPGAAGGGVVAPSRGQPGAGLPGPRHQLRLLPAAAHLPGHPRRDDLVDQLGCLQRQQLRPNRQATPGDPAIAQPCRSRIRPVSPTGRKL